MKHGVYCIFENRFQKRRAISCFRLNANYVVVSSDLFHAARAFVLLSRVIYMYGRGTVGVNNICRKL